MIRTMEKLCTSSPHTLQTLEAALARIEPHVRKTPVLTCGTLDALSGDKTLFFKCENFQKTGSFKARGALNAILSAKEAGDVRGIATHSSGNHGQAVAWAACKVANLPCSVVVPKW